MIRTVISDLGKVIIFFDNTIFFKKIADYCSFTAEEIAKLVSDHIDLIKYFDTGKITPLEFYNQVVKILKAKIDYETFFVIYNDVFFLNPPVVEVLKKLKSKYRLILLSNTDVMRFGFVKKKFPDVLIFDEYVLSFEAGYMKPHPEIYRKALQKAEARAEESIFIDDLESNVKAALSLGMDAILFGPQTDLESSLRDKGLIF